MKSFQNNPILNTPFDPPGEHWILDSHGQLTGETKEGRRNPGYVVPVASPRRGGSQAALDYGTEDEATESTLVKLVRPEVSKWRALAIPVESDT